MTQQVKLLRPFGLVALLNEKMNIVLAKAHSAKPKSTSYKIQVLSLKLYIRYFGSDKPVAMLKEKERFFMNDRKSSSEMIVGISWSARKGTAKILHSLRSFNPKLSRYFQEVNGRASRCCT